MNPRTFNQYVDVESFNKQPRIQGYCSLDDLFPALKCLERLQTHIRPSTIHGWTMYNSLIAVQSFSKPPRSWCFILATKTGGQPKNWFYKGLCSPTLRLQDGLPLFQVLLPTVRRRVPMWPMGKQHIHPHLDAATPRIYKPTKLQHFVNILFCWLDDVTPA